MKLSQILAMSTLLVSLNALNWPIKVDNVACLESSKPTNQNVLSALEENLNKTYDALPKETRKILKNFIDSIYGDSSSNSSPIKAYQIHDESNFDVIAEGLMKSLKKNGPSVVKSKAAQNDVKETLYQYVIDYMDEEIGKHCKSFMNTDQVSTLYGEFLSLIAKDPNAVLKDWKSDAIEALRIANVCHLVEANPMELYLLGSFNRNQLVAKLFAKENSEGERESSEVVLEPNQVESLLKTFTLVQIAHEQMNKDSDLAEYEDLAGLAQIVGDIDEAKCASGYINALTLSLEQFSQFIHLKTYLHTRILQQAQLCTKQLELFVRDEYKKNPDFEKSIRALRKEIEKVGDELDRDKSKIEPLYVEIADDVFVKGFESYLAKLVKSHGMKATIDDIDGASISELNEDEVFELIGNPTIKMDEEMRPMLAFSDELIKLIKDLKMNPEAIIDKTTLDVITEVKICEKMLSFEIDDSRGVEAEKS